MRQVNTGFPPVAGHFGVFRDAINPQAIPDVIKIDVAGLLDGAMQIDFSVAALQMAGVPVAVETRAAGAADVKIVVNHSGFESGQRHQRLEGRSRRKLRLNCAVQQRLARILN